MVELAATMFVCLVLFNLTAGFIAGAGGIENAIKIIALIIGGLICAAFLLYVSAQLYEAPDTTKYILLFAGVALFIWLKKDPLQWFRDRRFGKRIV